MNYKSTASVLITALAIGVTSMANATIISSADVPLRIPTGTASSGATTSTLNVGFHGTISDLNVLLNLNHTYDQDLIISLTGPNATGVTLSNRRGGAGNNFNNTVFDDEASVAISAGAAPFTGTYIPETSLSIFDGLDVFGLWTLTISDVASLDVGTLNSWALDVTTNNSVPEPASLALVALGLLGASSLRKRKQKKA